MDISKEDLQYLYDHNKNEDVAKMLKISIPTLLKLLRDSGINMKGSGNAYHLNKVRVVG